MTQIVRNLRNKNGSNTSEMTTPLRKFNKLLIFADKAFNREGTQTPLRQEWLLLGFLTIPFEMSYKQFRSSN
jgi:hypothetical protein